jgi:hypothetical protein
MRPDLRQQFLYLERLGDVINRAECWPLHSRFHVAGCTNKHELNAQGLFRGLNSLADVKSVDARHASVQENELGKPACDRRVRSASSGQLALASRCCNYLAWTCGRTQAVAFLKRVENFGVSESFGAAR